jgi:hypothetical protein
MRELPTTGRREARASLVYVLAAVCRDASVTSAPSLERLERAVKRFAAEARLDGVSIERTLAAVERCLGDSRAARAGELGYAQLLDDALRAAMDAYHAERAD